jgi:Uma2 family endonuclease
MQTDSRIETKSQAKTIARHHMRPAKQEKSVREQFLNLPEGTPCQLITGKIIMTPSPIPLHQSIAGRLYVQLFKYAEKNNLGQVFIAPLDVSFNEKDIFQPDVFFIRKDNLSIIGEKMIEGVPDLVVEVLSPSSAYHDLRTKFRVYEQSGVQEYWIVDLERKSVEVFSNSGKKFQLEQEVEGEGPVESLLLSGFSVAVDELF